MESPRPSECGATVGNPEGQVSAQVRDGVGVDDEWEYHSVCEVTPGRKPV